MCELSYQVNHRAIARILENYVDFSAAQMACYLPSAHQCLHFIWKDAYNDSCKFCRFLRTCWQRLQSEQGSHFKEGDHVSPRFPHRLRILSSEIGRDQSQRNSLLHFRIRECLQRPVYGLIEAPFRKG